MVFRSALVVTVVTALHPFGAHAQTPSANVAPSAAQPGDPVAGEIVVTAQRRSESLARTPVAVSVIGAEALQRQGIVSESDLQAAVPGLIVKAGSSSDQLNYAIRGQSLDAFSGVRPGVLPYFNEIQVATGGSSGFYDLQSVQVLKGPQGTLFGRNATGGAVLFTSAKPTNDFGGYASVRGGNYSHVQLEGALNVPIVDDKILLRIAGFFQRRDGFQHNLFDNSRVGDVKRENVRGSLTVKPSETITNDLVVDYAHSGGSSTSGVIFNIYPTGSTNAPAPANFLFTPAVDALFGPGGFQTYVAAHPGVDPDGIVAFTAKQNQRGPFLINVDSPNFYRSHNLVISNATTFDVGADTQIKNIFGYTHLIGRVGNDLDGSPYTVDQRGDLGGNNVIRQISNELQIIGKAFDRKLSYVAGFYFSDEKNDQRDLSVIFDILPFLPPTRQINSGITKNRSYAGYAQGTFDLSDIVGVEGLGITAGGRHTTEKASLLHRPDDVFILNAIPSYVTPQSKTFHKVSWQLGVQQQVNANLLLYVTSRSSFRSGGFNFYAAPVVGLGNDGGSAYAPEKATDIELGAKFQGDLAGMPVRFNLAAYTLWINDIQRVTYVQIAGAPAAVTVNVPKTKIQGFELDGFVRPVDWLSFGGSVNYTDARFTSNLVRVIGNPEVAFGPYPDVAKWSGGAFAEVSVPMSAAIRATLRGDVYAQTSTFYSSTANTLTPDTSLPGYSLVNVRLGLDKQEAGWSLSANLKNAFNKVYYVGGLALGNLFTLNTAVPGDRRTFLVEARYKF